MKPCPTCDSLNLPDARYCAQCGRPFPVEPPPAVVMEEPKRRFSFGMGGFFWSVALSLAITAVLTLVFNLPIFIFGAFLPFFFRPRSQ